MLRKIFITLSILATILASAAIGLNLSPYLARKLGFAPFKHAAVERQDIPGTLVTLIGAANESVVLASEVIDNRTVLEAVEAAGKRGVAVVVILSGPSNSSATRGARAWLAEHGVPARVTVEPFKGSIVIVDKLRAATSSSAMLSTGALSREQSSLFVFEHKATAQDLFERVRNWRMN